jgi:hypothetical protein
VQVAWGGVYTDAARATACLEDCFNQAMRLVQAVAGARTEGQMARDDRLIVVATDFSTSSVELRSGRLVSAVEEFDSPRTALEGALRLVRGVGRAE